MCATCAIGSEFPAVEIHHSRERGEAHCSTRLLCARVVSAGTTLHRGLCRSLAVVDSQTRWARPRRHRCSDSHRAYLPCSNRGGTRLVLGLQLPPAGGNRGIRTRRRGVSRSDSTTRLLNRLPHPEKAKIPRRDFRANINRKAMSCLIAFLIMLCEL